MRNSSLSAGRRDSQTDTNLSKCSSSAAVEAEPPGRKLLRSLWLGLGLAVLVGFNAGAQDVQSGRIVARINGLRSDNGIIRVTLWNNKDGFPTQAGKTFKVITAPVKNRTCTVVFDSLPTGTYAVAFIHDENANNRFDFNLLHIPVEGTGASNDARAVIGPPGFTAAAFRLGAGETVIEMKTFY